MPVDEPDPGRPRSSPSSTRDCRVQLPERTVTVAPGGKLTSPTVRNGWGTGCRIPDQAYFVGTAGRTGDHDFTHAQLLTNKSVCLQLP
jgi:hypothetical protein